MLINMRHLTTRQVISFCKNCSTQLSLRRITTSRRSFAAPTVEKTASRLKINRTGGAINDPDDKHGLEEVASNGISNHPLRLNMERVITSAEDTLDYRLDNLSNLLLWIRPKSSSGSKNIEGIPTPIHENEAKVIFASVEKLQGSQHPLLNYIKRFQAHDETLQGGELFSPSLQLRSMIVLLVANTFGFATTFKENANAQQKQKSIAEIAELMYTAHMIHRTVVEIPKEHFPTLGKVKNDSSSEPLGKGASMHTGNKVATLMGDLILARSSKALSSLEHPRVTELMSISIEDFAESEAIVNPSRVFISSSQDGDSMWNVNVQNQKDLRLLQTILTYDKWLKRTSLSVGSLLQNACSSSLIFGGHGENSVSSLGGLIGYKIGLALQAYKDFSIFDNTRELPQQIELCSLPFIHHLETNPKLLSIVGNPEQIYHEVRSNPIAKARTKETLKVLTNDAISHISKYSTSNTPSTVLKEFLTLLSS